MPVSGSLPNMPMFFICWVINLIPRMQMNFGGFVVQGTWKENGKDSFVLHRPESYRYLHKISLLCSSYLQPTNEVWGTFWSHILSQALLRNWMCSSTPRLAKVSHVMLCKSHLSPNWILAILSNVLDLEGQFNVLGSWMQRSRVQFPILLPSRKPILCSLRKPPKSHIISRKMKL